LKVFSISLSKNGEIQPGQKTTGWEPQELGKWARRSEWWESWNWDKVLQGAPQFLGRAERAATVAGRQTSAGCGRAESRDYLPARVCGTIVGRSALHASSVCAKS
jgi:hypothetical protein